MRFLVFGDVLLALERLAAFAAAVLIGWHGGFLHENLDTHARAGVCEHVLRSYALRDYECDPRRASESTALSGAAFPLDLVVRRDQAAGRARMLIRTIFVSSSARLFIGAWSRSLLHHPVLAGSMYLFSASVFQSKEVMQT